MSRVLVTEGSLQDIANAIREKRDVETKFLPGEMADAIRAIDTGGYPEPTGTVSITRNGTADVKNYALAVVDVPNSYTAEDEGKIVKSSALVPLNLQSKSVTENGTVTPDSGYDGLSSVVVDVQGGIGSGTTPPTSDMGSDGDGYVRIFPLPTDVNFVEYLQSSGTQYIDTGIVPTQEHDLYCKAKWIANDFLAGVRSGKWESISKSLLVCVSLNNKLGVIKTNKSVNGDTFVSNVSNPAIPAEVWSVTRRNNGILSVALYTNGHIIAIDNIANYTANGSFILFGTRVDGTIQCGAANICRLVLLEGGIPIADYLPCLDSNGVACMWDNIAGEYVYNDGTGDFSYGSAATPDALEPVLYIKKSGAWEVVRK